MAVSRNGKAFKAWKSALIVPLYKGKGSYQCTDNYCGINLLSSPSKVYVLLLMHHLGQCMGSQLHEAQCGFHGGRGTSMQCLLCISFQGGPRLAPTCIWPSLTSPRPMTTSTRMPYGKFFAPMVSLPASSASWRTCIRGHMPLCSLVDIWGTTFLSLVVCDKVVWLPLFFLMCSQTSSLRKPLGRC